VLWFNKPQFDKPRFDKPRLTAEVAQNLYTRNPSFDTDLNMLAVVPHATPHCGEQGP